MVVKVEKDFFKKHGKKFLIAYLVLVAIDYLLAFSGLLTVNGNNAQNTTNQLELFLAISPTVLFMPVVPLFFVMWITGVVSGIKNAKKQLQKVKELHDEGLVDSYGQPTDLAKSMNALASYEEEQEKTSYTEEEIAFVVRQRNQINNAMSPTRIATELMKESNSRYVPKGVNSYKREESSGTITETFTSGKYIITVITQPNGVRNVRYKHKYWWLILLGFFVPFFAIIAVCST